MLTLYILLLMSATVMLEVLSSLVHRYLLLRTQHKVEIATIQEFCVRDLLVRRFVFNYLILSIINATLMY